MTTKLHLACEQGQKPLAIVLTAGQRGDSPQFIPVLDRIRVPRRGGGRPRTRPARVLADKAYTSRANRAYLRRRGIKATIPSKVSRQRLRIGRVHAGKTVTIAVEDTRYRVMHHDEELSTHPRNIHSSRSEGTSLHATRRILSR